MRFAPVTKQPVHNLNIGHFNNAQTMKITIVISQLIELSIFFKLFDVLVISTTNNVNKCYLRRRYLIRVCFVCVFEGNEA